MNCDQAFDLITDPCSTDRENLAVHLAACPRCRTMQATLSPALEALAQPPSPSAHPANVAAACSAAAVRPLLAEVAGAAAMQLSTEALPAPRGSRRARVGQALSAVALLVLAAAGGGYAARTGALDGRSAAVAPLTPASLCTWQQPRTGAANPRTVIVSCLQCHLDASPAR